LGPPRVELSWFKVIKG